MKRGQITAGLAIAMTGMIITAGSIIFAFGGRIATIETKASNTEGVANDARNKAEDALTQTAAMRQKVDLIYDGLYRNGFIKK